jgi:surface protein
MGKYMKRINTYINEKLRLTAKQKYTCQPKDKNELKHIIIDRIKNEGNECDLNDIDVSKITDMSWLFAADGTYGNSLFKDFNGDISQWNVSNVENMNYMVLSCENFDCELSMWDVSNVEEMNFMFSECKKFDCDLSNWDVSNVIHMRYMFNMCEKFNSNISSWDVSKVEDMRWMFNGCKKFTQDLNSWDVSNVKMMEYAFDNCPTKPKWYK